MNTPVSISERMNVHESERQHRSCDHAVDGSSGRLIIRNHPIGKGQANPRARALI